MLGQNQKDFSKQCGLDKSYFGRVERGERDLTFSSLCQICAGLNCESPEILGPEEIRSYQVYLTNEKKLAPSSIIIAVAALRFLSKITLHKDWRLEEIGVSPTKVRKVPQDQSGTYLRIWAGSRELNAMPEITIL